MHLHEAKSIAEERHLKQCTKPERNIVETRAYWNPLVHRGDLLSWNETVVRLVECADNLLGRTPWLAALSYSLSLKYKDMQSLSRQYFFRVIQAMLSIHTCYWCAYAARERMEMMWTRSLTKAAPTATECQEQCRSLSTYCVHAVIPAKYSRHSCFSFACKSASQACGSLLVVTPKKLAMLSSQPVVSCLLGALRLNPSSTSSPNRSICGKMM